jgi:hypothetical protein
LPSFGEENGSSPAPFSRRITEAVAPVHEHGFPLAGGGVVMEARFRQQRRAPAAGSGANAQFDSKNIK